MDEENIENIDSLNDEGEVMPEVTEEAEVELELEAEPEVDVEKLQATNKKLYARLKALESKVKDTPKEAPQTNTINNNEQIPTRDEIYLIAKGYEDSEIAKLQSIAKGNGCSLLDATKDEMFVVWQEKVAAEAKKAKSQLGASKGSGSVRPVKQIGDMTDAEFYEHWKKTLNN